MIVEDISGKVGEIIKINLIEALVRWFDIEIYEWVDISFLTEKK